MKHIFLFSAALLLTALHTDLSAQIRIGGPEYQCRQSHSGRQRRSESDHAFRRRYRAAQQRGCGLDGRKQSGCRRDDRIRRTAEKTDRAHPGGRLPLNFKVYDVIDVNAFACGDGSIRVFSSLMDLMTDDELMAIIGHEIGHVVHTDVKDAMKNAYPRLGRAQRCRIGRRKHRRETLEFPIGGTDHRFHQRTVLAKTGEPGRRLRFRFLHCEQRRSLCDVECAEQTRGTFQIGGR